MVPQRGRNTSLHQRGGHLPMGLAGRCYIPRRRGEDRRPPRLCSLAFAVTVLGARGSVGNLTVFSIDKQREANCG